MDSIYSSQKGWQAISDCVAKHVLNVTQLENEIECEFLNGNTVSFDKRYVLEKGHDLETFIKNAYPFLNEFRKGNDLLMAVAVNGVESSKVCTLPTAFLQMFKSIQSPH